MYNRNVVRVTDATITDVIRKSERLILLARADWSTACRPIEEILRRSSSVLRGPMYGFLDADASSDAMQELHLTEIPTVLIFASGHEVERVGAPFSKDRITELIEKWRI